MELFSAPETQSNRSKTRGEAAYQMWAPFGGFGKEGRRTYSTYILLSWMITPWGDGGGRRRREVVESSIQSLFFFVLGEGRRWRLDTCRLINSCQLQTSLHLQASTKGFTTLAHSPTVARFAGGTSFRLTFVQHRSCWLENRFDIASTARATRTSPLNDASTRTTILRCFPPFHSVGRSLQY